MLIKRLKKISDYFLILKNIRNESELHRTCPNYNTNYFYNFNTNLQNMLKL